MIGMMTIARLELARRWPLWLIAAGLGLVANVMPSLSNDDRLADVCTVGVVVISWVSAFVVGMSLLGRPLHDGRLAFFFTRPIHGLAIAAGKLVGGLVLLLGMEALLLAPLVGSTERTIGEDGPQFVIFMTIVFLAVGVVVGILARSRSRWFVVDALGGTIAALLAVAFFAEVKDALTYAVKQEWTPEQAAPLFDRVDALTKGLAITAILVVLAAVAVAIAAGRTDRDRVHRSLALTLWPALGVTGLAAMVVAHWGLL